MLKQKKKFMVIEVIPGWYLKNDITEEYKDELDDFVTPVAYLEKMSSIVVTSNLHKAYKDEDIDNFYIPSAIKKDFPNSRKVLIESTLQPA